MAGFKWRHGKFICWRVFYTVSAFLHPRWAASIPIHPPPLRLRSLPCCRCSPPAGVAGVRSVLGGHLRVHKVVLPDDSGRRCGEALHAQFLPHDAGPGVRQRLRGDRGGHRRRGGTRHNRHGICRGDGLRAGRRRSGSRSVFLLTLCALFSSSVKTRASALLPALSCVSCRRARSERAAVPAACPRRAGRPGDAIWRCLWLHATPTLC
ncbi:unnamed protein product, partial [Phaeothamnion confervicola]